MELWVDVIQIPLCPRMDTLEYNTQLQSVLLKAEKASIHLENLTGNNRLNV